MPSGKWFSVEVWLLGLASALISGLAGGIVTGLSAIGIKPDVFNLAAGLHDTIHIAMAGALSGGAIGVANYLKQSPVPSGLGPQQGDGH